MGDKEAAASSSTCDVPSTSTEDTLPVCTSFSADNSSSVVPAKKKHEEKYRKKDPKSWDNISKILCSLPEEARLSYVQDRYRELYDELRKVTFNKNQLWKQCTAMQKEKDHNQTELAKSIVARARLENLCRELQKQNKQIKEENIAKIKEEEERRKEVSLKFADKLSDINNMMDENKEKSDKLREENLKMTAKLAELYSQFQKREEDISKMSHQLELERQYSQATLAKMELEIRAEKEIHAKEQAVLRSNLEKSEANCCVLLETVKGLQDHIDVYKNQYEDFESTMSKSAKVFDNFKFEIASMTKQVSTLEQEAQTWKNKFHDGMKALVELSETKRNQDLYLQSLEKKNEQLQKLCRQLQVDRANFLKLLKSHGIEPVSQCAKDDDAAKKGDTTKMTRKEKELQTLKDNLKAVQDELSRLSVEETDKNELSKTDDSTSPVPNFEDGAKSAEVQYQEEKIIEKSPSPEPISSQKVMPIESDRGLLEDIALKVDAQDLESHQNVNGDKE